jgi:Kyakuja-Dileera-Zisupton transposase
VQIFYDIACRWSGWAMRNGSDKLKELLRNGNMQVLVGAMHALMHNMSCQLNFAGLYCKNGTRCNGEGCETGKFSIRVRLLCYVPQYGEEGMQEARIIIGGEGVACASLFCPRRFEKLSF